MRFSANKLHDDSAGITALSAYEGNLILAGLTGILGAFLALQVSLSLKQPSMCRECLPTISQVQHKS